MQKTDYLEDYILDQLKTRIFSEENIPTLLRQLNERLKSNLSSQEDELKAVQENLDSVKKAITNVLTAIKKGITHSFIIDELNKLQQEEMIIESQIFELEAKKETVTVSEDTLRKLFQDFHKFVNEKNLVELKKFVSQYVEKILVYGDNVKVVFRFYIIVVLIGGGEGICTPVSKSNHKSVYACVL